MHTPASSNARNGVAIPSRSLCPFWPPEPKSPYLRSGKCLFRERIQPDVKARFLDFKPATHPGGTFPTGTMPCPRLDDRLDFMSGHELDEASAQQIPAEMHSESCVRHSPSET